MTPEHKESIRKIKRETRLVVSGGAGGQRKKKPEKAKLQREGMNWQRNGGPGTPRPFPHKFHHTVLTPLRNNASRACVISVTASKIVRAFLLSPLLVGGTEGKSFL